MPWLPDSPTLSKTSVTRAPGASSTATLSVKSTTAAAAGTYGIGAGTSGSFGSTHIAKASATYSVSVRLRWSRPAS